MALYDIPDHPVIRNMERTGYPDGKEPKYPICPQCGEECSIIYRDDGNDIVGCDNCIETYSTEEDDGDCPMCSMGTPDTFYKFHGDIIGCESCISQKDAWEWAAEQREAERW